MGIKFVWSILSPFCEKRPLYELQGKTVAIDLSCWICEAQNVTEYYVQPRMYLRNLYFRTCYLLLMDTIPVFVLEGRAPELKCDTMAARNAIQFKGARPKTAAENTQTMNNSKLKDRNRFKFVLKQCSEMLGYMGLACITGKGEAEATCAYLNDEGLVDGCISQDSDCFAYGAKVVYRNFSISQQGNSANSGGSVDIYDITRAYKNIGFGRNKIIALAVLCGCDYFEGINGIGKDSALKFFEKFTDEEILDRLKSWKKEFSLYDEFEEKINDKKICTSCGHRGSLASHRRTGCHECGTKSGCDFTKFKDERQGIKNELNMRSKALKNPDFPNEQLMNEYLTKKDKITELDLNWRQPNMIKFVKFTNKYLQWEEIYSFEKLFPILTRWQLLNFEIINSNKLKGIVYLDRIIKKRCPKGVPSFEILWSDRDKYFENIIPEDQKAKFEELKFWCTIEPQHLVEKAYPEVVEAFELSKIKGKKPAKRKMKVKQCDVETLENMMANTSISEPKPKKKSQKNKKENNQNLLNFVTVEKHLVQDEKQSFLHDITLEDDFNDAELDISSIIEKIMERDVFKSISDFKNENNCSFFMNNCTENIDLFEQSFNDRLVHDLFD